MPERLVSTTCLGNLNDPSYELLLRRKLGGVFEVDELLLDWDQADVCAFVGVTELGRTIDVRPDATDGGRLADATGTGEQVGMMQALLSKGVRQGAHHMLLTNQRRKIARPPLARENLITHAPHTHGGKMKMASLTPGTCSQWLWLLPSGPDQVHHPAMRGDPPGRILAQPHSPPTAKVEF